MKLMTALSRFIVTIAAIASFLPLWGGNHVVVSKAKLQLYVINESNDTIFSAPICCGANYGDKKVRGDMKTPEGTFKICQIQNSSKWRHDFKDGYGERDGAYGPYFLRLKVPNNSSIGIHGTCFPESIGTRASEGCIRLRNDDLLILRKLISVGTKCTIMPDACVPKNK